MNNKKIQKNIVNYVKHIYISNIYHSFSDDEIISIYWFDNNSKNILFPWILKIEREIKHIFLFYYSRTYNSFKDVILNSNKYKTINSEIRSIINKSKKFNTIDEYIYSMTLGQFIVFLDYFDENFKNKIIKYLNLSRISDNFLDELLISRNLIAHNKSLIEKNEISFKSILSNVFNYLVQNDTEKEKTFLMQFEENFQKLKNHISSSNYEKIIKYLI